MIFRNLLAGDPNKQSNNRAIIKVSRRRNLACLVTFVLISIVCIICGVLIGYFLRVRNFDTIDKIDNSDASTNRTVGLLSELISLDPVASTMVMNWYVVGDSCYGPSGVAPDDASTIPNADLCTPVNITFDTNLLRLNGDDWDKNLDNQDPSVPIFTWDPMAPYSESVFYSKVAVFRTTSALFSKSQLTSDKGPRDGSLQNYPFDSYQAYMVAYGLDGNGTSVQLQRVYSTGIAVGFTAISDNQSQEGIIIDVITFSRNALVKAYVFIIVIGVWIITLIFVGSVTKVVFGYQQPIEAFVIPIGTLFAITSLRGSMPGAPNGFGAIIDFVGILPCLAIITLTGVFLFAFLVIAKNIEGVMAENEAENRVQAKLDASSI